MDMLIEGISSLIRIAFQQNIMNESNVKEYLMKLTPKFKEDVIFHAMFPKVYDVEYTTYQIKKNTL